MKRYKYIGPNHLIPLVKDNNKGKEILSQLDLIDWISETNQELDEINQVIVTFIINTDGKLLIADRHSEHIVCANGMEVLPAGEMNFEINDNGVELNYQQNGIFIDL